MRVLRYPALSSGGQQQRCATGAAEGFAFGAQPNRVPRHDDAQALGTAEAMQLLQSKRELFDMRPNVAPLLPLQAFAAFDHCRKGAERDHVLREQQATAFEVHGLHTRLHLEEEVAGD